MHGSNRLGGNSLSDLLVFGRRAGDGAADYVKALGRQYPPVADAAVQAAPAHRRWRRSTVRGRREPVHAAPGAAAVDERPGRHHPQGDEVEQALDKLQELQGAGRARSASRAHRQFNPGWHLALDLRNMLLVCECVARAALMREESRGGHTRDDFPEMDRRTGGRST